MGHLGVAFMNYLRQGASGLAVLIAAAGACYVVPGCSSPFAGCQARRACPATDADAGAAGDDDGNGGNGGGSGNPAGGVGGDHTAMGGDSAAPGGDAGEGGTAGPSGGT